MSGYTPLFSSLTTGTLCGRWPDIGLWPIILSMSDKNGIVDVTTNYISSVTGLSHEDVVGCMQRFCEPDKYSRSDAENGARLVLLDEHRPWGWRIVNHTKYREKARKQASDSQRVASGAEAERKRASRAVPRCPATSRADPPSDSDSDSDSDSEKSKRKKAPRAERATRLPSDFHLTPDRRRLAESERLDPSRTFQNFTDYWRSVPDSKGKKLDWDATWRVWCRNDRQKLNGNHQQQRSAVP